MKLYKPLNIFYEEPDPDRWIKYDRYPRKLIRKIFRGKQRPGGVMMVALNLMAGLNRLKIPYRFNDYTYIKKHPEELVCIIGKPHLLFNRKWQNPILFGAGVFSHPIDYPNLFEKHPHVEHLLVPGEWMRKMFEPYYADKVSAWPTGIDTQKWSPVKGDKQFDFLIYDKILWQHKDFEKTLIEPLKQSLKSNNFNYHTIRYGFYSPKDLAEKLKISKAVIFLCEHETQGLAYQQILSCNIPILAWDLGGYWQDPTYYPHKVEYAPVSSVPYWDDRCGIKFTSVADFETSLKKFYEANSQNRFSPRSFILDNLTLEICALKYTHIVDSILQNIKLRENDQKDDKNDNS